MQVKQEEIETNPDMGNFIRNLQVLKQEQEEEELHSAARQCQQMPAAPQVLCPLFWVKTWCGVELNGEPHVSMASNHIIGPALGRKGNDKENRVLMCARC